MSLNLTVLRTTQKRGFSAAEVVGATYGRLTITALLGAGSKGSIVNAICSCGSGEKRYALYRLRSGKTNSCGCYQDERRRRERPATSREDAIKRIFERTKPNGECQIWTGAVDDNGYAMMSFDGDHWRVSRLVFLLCNGELPAMVCHRCDVPACINPIHLFAGDHQANMDDMWRKGRGTGKLTVDQYRAILIDERRAGLIAKDYGISRSLVWLLKTGKSGKTHKAAA